MANEGFYLILPSNVISNRHKNKTSHFYTDLPIPLELDKDKWEVALVEIDFPRSWNNVVRNRSRITLSRVDAKGKIFKQIFPLKSGHYNSEREIIRYANDRRNSVIKSYFQFDEISKKAKIIIEQGESVQISATLSHMMGFLQPVRFIHPTFYNVTPHDEEIVKIGHDTELEIVPQPVKTRSVTVFGDKAFDLNNGLYSIYVYTNIIQDTIVGNTLAPLLRTVLASGNYGDIIQKTFVHPHYMRLAQDRIADIEISLRDDTGNLIPFEFGKVLVKLHFRKKGLTLQ